MPEGDTFRGSRLYTQFQSLGFVATFPLMLSLGATLMLPILLLKYHDFYLRQQKFNEI
jgi:hypothetical protein